MTTRQEKIQKIREACIEASPDILKLEFGCEVTHSEDGIKGFIVDKVEEDYKIYWTDISKTTTEELGDFEIIGRKITLCDILLSLNEIRRPQLHLFNSFGAIIVKTNIHYHRPRTNIFWNLKQNDLELQSEETVNYLYEILCLQK